MDNGQPRLYLLQVSPLLRHFSCTLQPTPSEFASDIIWWFGVKPQNQHFDWEIHRVNPTPPNEITSNPEPHLRWVLFVKGERARERDNRLRALRPLRPQALGCVGVCGQGREDRMSSSNIFMENGQPRVYLVQVLSCCLALGCPCLEL